ncbi:3-isopropylmalate dehydratase small subunit [Halovivax gelatinilyticus]|uniref:3-isopropylmalate dehydratase small subunit n=1 Tax=Halovivax gelatinilyticus TaxID=2961597 RepID=UPI0020CA67DF|nr:3-isopropylmalate dehydratase small subunit [Halovivax gelatinilyticus]
MTDERAATVERVSASAVPVRGNDVDTDQIIPARFLKAVTFDGLGQFAFFDQRFDSATPKGSRDGDGDSAAQSAAHHSSGQRPREEAVGATDNPLEHPFNEERFAGASLLVVNANFGCGSSREHAPQALKRWGIDAIVGESFAEIFAGNCLALGIPTATLDPDSISSLQAWIERNPAEPVTLDLLEGVLEYGDRTLEVSIDESHRRALTEGTWDTTSLMRSNRAAVDETARSLPYVQTESTDGDATGADR